jgi:hypothetical protein
MQSFHNFETEKGNFSVWLNLDEAYIFFQLYHRTSTPTVTFPAISVYGKEVAANTTAVISCSVTDITEQMNITWSGFDADDRYVQTSGSYDDSTNSQTGTLTVDQSATTEDKTYTCTVTSLQNMYSAEATADVILNVYSKK